MKQLTLNITEESDVKIIASSAFNFRIELVLQIGHDDLNDVVNSLQGAYEFVQTESDYQGDDIILWQELSDSDFYDDLYSNIPDQLNNNIDLLRFSKLSNATGSKSKLNGS